jgi:hypothetical protein
MEASNNQKSESKILTGTFPDKQSADKAYHAVTQRGYTKDEINIIMSKEVHKKYLLENDKETGITDISVKNAGKDSAIGASVGAIVGIATVIGVGGLAGGLLGMLIGLEISEEDAKVIESGINGGQILITVHPKNDADKEYFETQWKANKGENIQ